MDMLQIFSDSILGMVGVSTTDDQISGRSIGDFICNMAWQNELAIAPANRDLNFIN